MKDSEIEWFRPLWLRILVTGLVAIWFGFELFLGRDMFWIAITGAALAYAVWNLFIRFDANAAKKPDGTTGNDNGKPQA